MRTVRVLVQVTEPKRTRDGTLTLGLEILDEGIRLEGRETAHMSLHFPIGPDDVGLVLPLDVTIFRKGEEAPPQPADGPHQPDAETLAAARAELARKRAAGELPPVSPEAQKLLEQMRRRLERGDAQIRLGAGHGPGGKKIARSKKVPVQVTDPPIVDAEPGDLEAEAQDDARFDPSFGAHLSAVHGVGYVECEACLGLGCKACAGEGVLIWWPEDKRGPCGPDCPLPR
jgi:hypothetical protein